MIYDDELVQIPAMTLRQWYKGMALAGLRVADWDSVDRLAAYAGEVADALLREDEEAGK